MEEEIKEDPLIYSLLTEYYEQREIIRKLQENTEEVFNPEIFSELQYLEIIRINSCHTISELFDYLILAKELEGDTEYHYDMYIVISNDYDPPWQRGFRTKVIRQMTLNDLINYIEEWINELQEAYHDDRVNMDIIVDVFLRKINPWYGVGKEMKIFKILNNKPYTINFLKTINKCLLKCTLLSLGRSLKSREITNFNEYYDSNLNTLNLIQKIEERHTIQIKITSSFKTLEQYIQNKQEDEVILFSKNKHIGYLKQELPTINALELKEQKSLKVEKKSEIIYGAYDFEWEWVKQAEGKKFNFINKPPNLVTLIYKNENILTQKVFNSVKLFLQYISILVHNTSKNMYLYAHNAQRVEHQFIIEELIKDYTRNKKKPDIELNNINGKAIKSYSWNQSNYKRIYFYDTLLYMKMSLKNIAESYQTIAVKGHEAQGEQSDEEFFRNKKWDWKDPKDVEYCMNDSKILLEFIEKFNEQTKSLFSIFNEDIWILNKSSISSINKDYIFSMYPNLSNDTEQAMLFAEAFYGGRTEIFFRGTIKPEQGIQLRVIDIKSAYPDVMINVGFHGRFIGYLNRIPKSTKLCRWMMFAKVKYINKYRYPPLAIKKDGKLLFPNFITYQTRFIFDFEYYELKSNLKIKEVIEVFGFEEQKFPFLKEIYDLKERSKDNKALYESTKVQINGCFGSLAMNLYRPSKSIVNMHEIEIEDITCKDEVFYDQIFNDTYWRTSKDLITTNVCMQGAASITAYCRLKLWKKLCELREAGCKPLYCDTDSVYFQCYEDYPHEANTKELGSWDEEIKSEMSIFSCKAYICDGKAVIKGMKKNDVNIDATEVLQHGLRYINSEWRIGVVGRIGLTDTEKFARLQYTKGCVKKNGRVVPFDL